MSEHVTESAAPAGLSRRTLFRSAGVAGAAAVVATAGAASAVNLQQAASTATEPLKLVRVWFRKDQQSLLHAFDETHTVYEDGSMQVLLWPGDLAKLKETGLRFAVEVEDLVARDAALFSKPVTRTAVAAKLPGERADGTYRQLADFEADMRALAAQYPDKAKLIVLPFNTLEGRSVYGLEIARDVNRKDGRPVFYNDGCHHAREWPAAEVPIMWAYDLLENDEKDDRITAIMTNVRNIVVPVVNVDGFEYSRKHPMTAAENGTTNTAINTPFGLLTQGSYWRKNKRSLLMSGFGVGVGRLNVVDAQKPGDADAYGVDPNRNYSYAWGDDAGGTSSSLDSGIYRGEKPLSEAETANVAEVLKSVHATAMISHHTSGNLVLWAWGDTTENAPDNDPLEGFGRAMAVYNGYTPQKSIQLYVTTGTCSDYAYGVTGSIGYTFEHAGSTFHPPYASTVPAMYEKNRESLIMLAVLGCMKPEDRPTLFRADDEKAPEAQAVLEEFGVAEPLVFGIISGRAVDAAGNPVAAQLTLERTFDTLLWKDGNGGNPTGQATVRERIETTMETGPDGVFEWSVNPSTRPAFVPQGKVESYLLTVTATGGKGEGFAKRIVVERGQRYPLGDVVVA